MASETVAAILIGDSHYAAIASAAQETLTFAPEDRRQDLIFFDAWKYALKYPFTVEGSDGAALNSDLAQSIRTIAGNYDRTHVFSVFGGGHHLAITLLDNRHPMDVVLPSKPDLPLRQDAKLLSVDFVKEIFLQLISSSFQTIASLKSAIEDIPYSQIECPPPNRDNEFIRKNLGPYFESNFSAEELDAISTPAQRYKFWVLQSEMYAAKCAELGVEYMRVPQNAISEEGYLNAEHYGTDSTHANSAYGRLILDAIEARIGHSLKSWNSFG